jgi:hypothetical protein
MTDVLRIERPPHDRTIEVPQHVHVVLCRTHGPFLVMTTYRDACNAVCGECGCAGRTRVVRFVPEDRKLRFRR